jgi:hypothetical protein
MVALFIYMCRRAAADNYICIAQCETDTESPRLWYNPVREKRLRIAILWPPHNEKTVMNCTE